jgi:hypothetical protein
MNIDLSQLVAGGAREIVRVAARDHYWNENPLFLNKAMQASAAAGL